MGNELIVIMGASEVYGTMPLYTAQLQAAGIETAIVSCSDKPNMNGGGTLGYRVSKFRELANQYSDYERIVITDAFDVTFWGRKEDVISKIPMDRLIHAGEKNCYPPEACSLPIPDRGPWRYANGGMVAGTPEHFLHWCCYTERHLLYNPECLDQYFLNLQISEEVGCLPDYRTELFLCLYGGYDEISFTKGLPINNYWNTRPSFVHANGKCPVEDFFYRQQASLSNF